MSDEKIETEAEIREKYEPAIWAALDYAVTMAAIHDPARVAKFTALTEELGRKGWGIRFVFGPPLTGTKGLFFYRVPKDEPRCGNGVPIEAMTDRELLVKLSDMFHAYDRRRDDELNYLDKNPVKDAWDDNQREEYKEIVGDVLEQYSKIAKVLDHIDRSRRVMPVKNQTPGA